jgi:hypothetical protein
MNLRERARQELDALLAKAGELSTAEAITDPEVTRLLDLSIRVLHIDEDPEVVEVETTLQVILEERDEEWFARLGSRYYKIEATGRPDREGSF